MRANGTSRHAHSVAAHAHLHPVLACLQYAAFKGIVVPKKKKKTYPLRSNDSFSLCRGCLNQILIAVVRLIPVKKLLVVYIRLDLKSLI